MAFHRPGVMPSVFGIRSLESLGSQAPGVGASGAPGTVNTTLYVPLQVTETITIVKGWWVNGATVSGNVDIGLYPETGGAKIVSLGSTAQSGTNTLQEGNIADTVVPPGRYLMALAWSSATATFFGTFFGSSSGKSLGFAMEAAFALPASATPVVFDAGTIANVPVFGFSQRTLVA